MKDLMSFLPDISVHLGEPLTEQLIELINYDLLKSQIFSLEDVVFNSWWFIFLKQVDYFMFNARDSP